VASPASAFSGFFLNLPRLTKINYFHLPLE
jgi:hypothetical protein